MFSSLSMRFLFCVSLIGAACFSSASLGFAKDPPPVHDFNAIIYSKKIGDFWRLYQVDATNKPRPVFTSPDPKLAELNQESPTWSPDGKRVAFLGYKKRPAGSVGALYDQDVYVVQENGAVFPVTTYHFLTITSIAWASPEVLLVLFGDPESVTQRIVAIDLSKPTFTSTTLWQMPSTFPTGDARIAWMTECGGGSISGYPLTNTIKDDVSLDSIEVGSYNSSTDYDISIRCSRIIKNDIPGSGGGMYFTDPPYSARIVRLQRLPRGSGVVAPEENAITKTSKLASSYEAGNPNIMGGIASQSFALRKTLTSTEASINDHPYGFFYTTVEGDIAYAHRGQWTSAARYGGVHGLSDPDDSLDLPFSSSTFLYDPSYIASAKPATAPEKSTAGTLVYVAGQTQIDSQIVKPYTSSLTPPGMTEIYKHAGTYWDNSAVLYKKVLVFTEDGLIKNIPKGALVPLDAGAPIQHPTIRPLTLSKPPAYVPKPGDPTRPVPPPPWQDPPDN